VENFAGDLATATLTPLAMTFGNASKNNTVILDLSEFAGKTFAIVFQYTSTAEEKGTFEVIDLSLKEKVTNEDQNPNPNPTDNDGTYEKPYTCANLLAMELATNSNGTGYVAGYIVGSVNGSILSESTAVFGTEGAATSNMLIADSPDERDWSKCVAVKANNSFKANVYVSSDPTALGKKVVLYGTIKKYMGVSGVNQATYCELYSSDNTKTELGTKPTK
jgi:hypothetical protein